MFLSAAPRLSYLILLPKKSAFASQIIQLLQLFTIRSPLPFEDFCPWLSFTLSLTAPTIILDFSMFIDDLSINTLSSQFSNLSPPVIFHPPSIPHSFGETLDLVITSNCNPSITSISNTPFSNHHSFQFTLVVPNNPIIF